MKRHGIALAAVLFAAGNAHAALDNAAAQALMQKDGCAACHAIDKKVVGPSYQDVAAKYKGDKDALAKLSTKVKEAVVASGVRFRCRRTLKSATPTSRIWSTGF